MPAFAATPPGLPAPGPEQESATLIEALRDPSRYPHPVAAVEVLETHISWVLLAGDFAYKVKKPVRLPFLDFSTLGARRRYCEAELRLNRRTAPDIYLDVVAIGGSPRAPRLDGPPPAIEYAVRMRRFPQEALFRSLAIAGRLRREHVDAFADALAAFHGAAACATEGAAAPAQVAAANFDEIAALDPPPAHRDDLAALREWTAREAARLGPRFEERARQGFVRECHGDLHLGNVVLIDARAVLFDCIEFSEPMRRTDVMADVAFATMDFARVGRSRLGARFLNRYLERTGDYAGLDVLRFHEVYRAMVRAKVAAIRLRQEGAGARGGEGELAACLRTARLLAQRAAPAVIVMQGLCASGKTTVSERLVEALGAVRVRSDVERKRLHGLEASARAGAAPGEGIYGEPQSRETYDRLAALAQAILAAGRPAVVDAAFLRRAERERFGALAAAAGAGFQVVSCFAPPAVLRARVAARERAGSDASDAGLAVLEAQLASAEPLGDDERRHATFADTDAPGEWKGAVESLARRFGARELAP